MNLTSVPGSLVDDLKETDQRKDEFLATLAHELRTPLAPIRNGLEILRRQPTREAAEKVCEMMDRQLTHMVQLIDDLLDMSRVSKGKIELRTEKASLQSIIQAAVETAQPYIETAGHTLRLEVAAAPIWIEADLTRVDQIVTNLLSNAAKYTANGGTIVLSAYEEHGHAVIAVRDNGIGIPAHMLTTIFDLFTQVSSSLNRSQGGLGIGLALVKQLVNLHGGSIQVESQGHDKGSTFTVRIPLAPPPSELATPFIEENTMNVKPLNILVVDDNADSATTTGWLLESMGYRDYHIAQDGPQALETALETLPDVILLDIGLPGMNGYEVCRQLRRNPLFTDTVIIAQTGWGQDRDREMAYFAGFNHHLVKPLNPAELGALFAKVVPRPPSTPNQQSQDTQDSGAVNQRA